MVHRGGFGSQPSYRADGAVPLPLATWRHLAGVKTATELILYVDGEPVATTPTSELWNSGGYGIHLGRSSRDESALREAQLWLRDLSEEQEERYVSSRPRLRALRSEKASPAADGPNDDRPFAAPVFWAPFTFTGA